VGLCRRGLGVRVGVWLAWGSAWGSVGAWMREETCSCWRDGSLGGAEKVLIGRIAQRDWSPPWWKQSRGAILGVDHAWSLQHLPISRIITLGELHHALQSIGHTPSSRTLDRFFVLFVSLDHFFFPFLLRTLECFSLCVCIRTLHCFSLCVSSASGLEACFSPYIYKKTTSPSSLRIFLFLGKRHCSIAFLHCPFVRFRSVLLGLAVVGGWAGDVNFG